MRLFSLIILLVLFEHCASGGKRPKQYKRDFYCDRNDTLFKYPDSLNTIDASICDSSLTPGVYRDFTSFFFGDKTAVTERTNPEGFFQFHLDDNGIRADIFVTKVKPFINVDDSLSYKIKSRFYDSRKAIFLYDRNTLILFDKQARKQFCFIKDGNFSEFNSKSIFKVYLLDEKLMPTYVINGGLGDTISASKFFYDDKYPVLYSYPYQIGALLSKRFQDLSFDEIISLFSNMETGRYKLIENMESHLSGFFKRAPLWTEY